MKFPIRLEERRTRATHTGQESRDCTLWLAEGVTYCCPKLDLSKNWPPPGFEPGSLGVQAKCSAQRAMVSMTVGDLSSA